MALLPQSEQLGFIDDMSTFDNLRLFSSLSKGDAQHEIERLAHRFRIARLPSRIARASGGERIRLSAIRGLLPRTHKSRLPEVVIADEPTAGVDDAAAQALAEAFCDLARQKDSVVIVATHDPRLFCGPAVALPELAGTEPRVHLLAVDVSRATSQAIQFVATLRREPDARPRGLAVQAGAAFRETFENLGRAALSPLAFCWGLRNALDPIHGGPDHF